MIKRRTLPECTIARAGFDLFSSRKDLTVVMIPFERFSPFAKAVDDLYRGMDTPFNLIIIEGNAPESVRASLEKRQHKHKNISIIYSDHQTSIGAAINLAAPHLKTKYAFFMDNDVRVSRGAIGRLLCSAVENDYEIVCPQNYVVDPSFYERRREERNIQSLGVRTCFLISRAAILKFGKFDETMTPFTTGIDIRMASEELGISIYNETATCLALNNERPSWPMDASLHSFQWDKERVSHSLKSLEKKWGIRLQEKDYAAWLEGKQKDLEESKNFLSFVPRLFSRLKSMNYERGHKNLPNPVLIRAA